MQKSCAKWTGACRRERSRFCLNTLRAAYDGPHEVLFNRNETNLYVRRLMHCMELVPTDFLVITCGDDVQEPKVSIIDLLFNVGEGARDYLHSRSPSVRAV